MTRHVGPYKAALRGVVSLYTAAARSGERDRRAALGEVRER
ncbi:hypothetical protein O7626_40455 [Micromonospora sp. WMMD1102]|nr:hypothetical protein [Micromonospora sp. WMMD1102]MDG4792091.1 hypothetical protein [Micromonospora sp. WMMD1102]